MEKYKICPVCKEKNYPGLLECLYCEADLAAVRIADDEAEAAAKAAEKEGKSARLVRLCDCGAKNPPNARKCTICGEDISDVIPASDEDENLPSPPEKEEALAEKNDIIEEKSVVSEEKSAVSEEKSDVPEEKAENPEEKATAPEERAQEAPATVLNDKVAEELAPKPTLVALDGTYRFVLQKGETVVGRNAAMAEYLVAKPYVSRIHCRFLAEEKGLFVENLSATNYTFLNNRMVTGKTLLSEGDEVALGGLVVDGKRQERAAYFRVKLKA